MKFNKKGMTLIELLIALLFSGIILVFMFSMLNSLKGETDTNSYAYNNQVNKIDSIHKIQQDLNTYALTGIQSMSNTEFKLNFYYLKGNESKTAKLYFTKKLNKTYLNYENVDGEKNAWEMKGAKIDTCGKITIYNEGASSYNYNEQAGTEQFVSNNYYFKIIIPVYNSLSNEFNNKNNNNVIDDLEITFSGYNFNLLKNNSYLTSKTNGTYNIGKC